MVPLRSIQRSWTWARSLSCWFSCDYYFTSSGCVATCILFILAFIIQTLSSTLTSSFGGDHGYSKEIFQSLFAAMAVGFVAQFRYGREEKEIYIFQNTQNSHTNTHWHNWTEKNVEAKTAPESSFNRLRQRYV